MELSKVRTMEQIIASFKDGQTIAIGGQTNHYMPERLIDCVLESGAKHLTVYSIDSSDPGMGISRIIEAGRVDKMITTHVGTNPRTNARIQDGSLKAELIPMGTFIERIRCGGMGLGGVLTKTGLGGGGQADHRGRWSEVPAGDCAPRRRGPDSLPEGRSSWQPGLSGQQRPRLPPGHRHLRRPVHRGVRSLLRSG